MNLSLHSDHIRKASFVSFLIFGAPGSNNVSQMAALILNLSVVAHGDVGDGVDEDERIAQVM